MTSPLNSPFEVGMRVLMLLVEAFPRRLDLDHLVLFDHALLHSEDLGGPTSLHPALPIRAGEFAVRRQTVSRGLEIMIRAGLVDVAVTPRGFQFGADDRSEGFIAVLASAYARRLNERAAWTIATFRDLDQRSLRERLRWIFDSWSDGSDDLHGGSD